MTKSLFFLPALAVLLLLWPGNTEAIEKQDTIFIQAASFADYNNAVYLYNRLYSLPGACLVECEIAGKKYYRIKIAAVEGSEKDFEKALYERFGLKAIRVRGIKPGEKVLKENSAADAADSAAAGNGAVPVEAVGDVTADSLINTASSFMGAPYRFGGKGVKGFDCSGLVWRSYEINGVKVPRNAGKQFEAGDSIDELIPGDLVFFRTYKDGVSHVGIYLGDGRFIHSATGEGVKISLMSEEYYRKRYAGAKRLAIRQ